MATDEICLVCRVKESGCLDLQLLRLSKTTSLHIFLSSIRTSILQSRHVEINRRCRTAHPSWENIMQTNVKIKKWVRTRVFSWFWVPKPKKKQGSVPSLKKVIRIIYTGKNVRSVPLFWLERFRSVNWPLVDHISRRHVTYSFYSIF